MTRLKPFGTVWGPAAERSDRAEAPHKPCLAKDSNSVVYFELMAPFRCFHGVGCLRSSFFSAGQEWLIKNATRILN
jgi:hypothetical protein